MKRAKRRQWLWEHYLSHEHARATISLDDVVRMDNFFGAELSHRYRDQLRRRLDSFLHCANATVLGPVRFTEERDILRMSTLMTAHVQCVVPRGRLRYVGRNQRIRREQDA